MNRAIKNHYLACDLYAFLKKMEMWDGTIIYYNGIAWTDSESWGGESGTEVEPGVYQYDRDPRDYMRYCDPTTVSVSFEGGLYEVVNSFGADPYGYCWNRLNEIFKEYGYFFELGTYTTLYACDV